MKSFLRTCSLIVLVSAVCNAHECCHDHEHENEDTVHLSGDQIQHYGIDVREAGPGFLVDKLTTRGKIILHPDHLVHVLPNVPGIAETAFKNIGDPVKKGEIIAIVQSQEMAEIKAGYLAALEKESLAKELLDREERLREKKISPEQDYLNAKSHYQEAKIETRLARQKLQAFGIGEDELFTLTSQQDPDLCSYFIRSPLEGTIINRHITKGEWIDNSMTIYEIANLSSVWVEIGIFPKDLPRVREGQIVKVRQTKESDEGKEAKIIFVSPVVIEESITSKAVAEMDNKANLWRPGTFVKVDIAMDQYSCSVIVPKEAVQEIEGEQVVFIRVEDGFEKREVSIGKSDGDQVELLRGLELGEPYAASQTFLLKADLGKHDVEHEHD